MNEYIDQAFDLVLTVCDNAKEQCPYFPGNVQRFHYNFPDPAKATGTEEEIMKSFHSTRDMIKDYSRDFIRDHV